MDASAPAGPGRELVVPESSKCPLAGPSTPSHPLTPSCPPLHGSAPPSLWPGKQTLKIFDGNDSVLRNHSRAITVPRQARNQEVLVRGGARSFAGLFLGGRRDPA